MCLLVLEREPACPLIRACLTADPAITAGEQDAPQRNGTEEATSNRTERKGKDTDLSPHSIPVKRKNGMEEGGDGKCGEGIRRFRVGC